MNYISVLFILDRIQAQDCDTGACMAVTPDSSGRKISPSCRPAAPSCPTYRTPETTLLTVDLLSHRAFSAVIPNCRHSCGAKIDLQILDCDSRFRIAMAAAPFPAGIGWKNVSRKMRLPEASRPVWIFPPPP